MMYAAIVEELTRLLTQDADPCDTRYGIFTQSERDTIHATVRVIVSASRKQEHEG